MSHFFFIMFGQLILQLTHFVYRFRFCLKRLWRRLKPYKLILAFPNAHVFYNFASDANPYFLI